MKIRKIEEELAQNLDLEIYLEIGRGREDRGIEVQVVVSLEEDIQVPEVEESVE